MGLARPREKYVKDVVYGFIRLPSDVFDTLVDTPLMQRLRWILQTSLSKFVYPGMGHDRLSHSLGVAYAMRRALAEMTRNTEALLPAFSEASEEASACIARVIEEVRRLEAEAVVAALLHDVGHLPLSHVFESALRDPVYRYTSPGVIHSVEGSVHEELSLAIVEWLARSGFRVTYAGGSVDLGAVRRILELAYRGGVCRVALEECEEAARDMAMCLVARLLSGSVDVDRADYMLRDSLHAGVTMGVHDIERLFQVLVVVPSLEYEHGRSMLRLDVGVLEKGVAAVESVLLGRAFMYAEVYTHNVASVYEAMASHLLALVLTGLSGLEEVPRGFHCLSTVLNPSMGSEWFNCFIHSTDDLFWSLVRALSYDVELLKAIAEGFAKVHNCRECTAKACLALALLAQGLISRRHLPAFYVAGERAARLVEKLGRSVALRESLGMLASEPLVAVSYASYRVYDASKPIMVLRLRSPLDPAPLHEVATAVVSSRVRGVVHAKFFVAVPLHEDSVRPPAGWLYRRGKLSTEDLAMAAQRCGIDYEQAKRIAYEAVRRAVEVMESLSKHMME